MSLGSAWILPPPPNAEGNREELQPAIYMGNGVLNSVEKKWKWRNGKWESITVISQEDGTQWMAIKLWKENSG